MFEEEIIIEVTQQWQKIYYYKFCWWQGIETWIESSNKQSLKKINSLWKLIHFYIILIQTNYILTGF